MFKNMKLGMKIASLAGILVIIASIMSFVGYISLTGVVDRVEKADDVNRMIKFMLGARQQEKNFIIRGGKEYIDKVQKEAADLKRQATETKDDFKDPVNKQQMDDILASAGRYEKAFADYVSYHADEKAAEEKMVKAAREFGAMAETIRAEQKKELAQLIEAKADKALIEDKMVKADDANRIIRWGLICRQEEKNFLMRGDKKYAESVDKHVEDIINLAKDMKTRFNQAGNKGQADHIISSALAYRALFDSAISSKEKKAEAATVMVTAARACQEIGDKARADQKAKMENEISSAKTMMMIGAGVGILLGVLLAFFIIRGITKAINRIIENLNDGADQVACASGEVSSASQSLAEGAAEQASAIEETSSSLEEMSSMTKQNADNAQQADSLMKESGQAVVMANESMSELTTSMAEVSKASEETSKIIKTIDEIAFQTNLLALNAAVEAARAGEHGAGFAVVAEEVRNLAMRSADAAKNTSVLIEDTVTKVKNGSGLVNRASEVFGTVADSSSKVGELVGEIAAASNEQAQGIGQVNNAVTEMDKVTQQSAANAEETASASEELSAQAEQMKNMVGELIALVGGSEGKVSSKEYGAGSMGKGGAGSAVGAIRKAITPSATKSKALAVPKAREVKPDEVIPMDDDFKDF